MILVTGGTGLVGSNLLHYLLSKGESVRAIYRNKDKIEIVKSFFEESKSESLYNKIDWIEADIIDIPSLELAFKNIEMVYHCAALISFDPKEEEKLRKTNIEGTANMVNCALDFGVKKFCYVSSIAALGDLASHEKIINEETEWNPEKPHSDYALSKYGAEMELWRAFQEGLPIIIVNPGVILGAGFWELGSGEIFKKIDKGIPFYTKGSSGFIDVKDVVAIMFQLMKSSISGERFILVSENVVYKNLITWISEALNRKKPSFYAKPWMTSLAWRMDWVLSKLFFTKRSLSRAMAKSLHSKDQYSNDKIKNVIDFELKSIKVSSQEIALIYQKTNS